MTATKAIAASIVGLGTSSAGIFGTYKLLTPKTVEAQLLRDGYTILSSSDENSEWEKIKDNNKEDSKKKELQKFIKDHGQKEERESEEIKTENIKDACEKLLKKEPTSENMKSAQEYCAKKSNQ